MSILSLINSTRPVWAGEANRPRKALLLLFLIIILFTRANADEMDIADEDSTPESLKNDDGPDEVPEPLGADETVGQQPIPDFCVSLYGKYMKEGHVAKSDREAYCLNGCDFLKYVQCIKAAPKPVLPDYAAMYVQYVTDVIRDGVPEDESVVLVPDADTVEEWWDILYRTWPVFVTCIPILLVQWKMYNWGVATLFIIAFALIQYLFSPGYAMSTYNVSISLMCALSPSGGAALVDSLGTIVGMIIAIGGMYHVAPIAQFLYLIIVLIVGVFFCYRMFYVKKTSSSISVLIAFLQIWVLMEQLQLAREITMNYTLASGALEAVLNSMYPSGRSQYFFKNVLNVALVMAKRVPSGALFPQYAFTFAMVYQFILYIFFRACLGAFYLHQLRYKFTLGNLAHGWWIYQCDVFGPFVCLFRLLYGLEKHSVRRLAYGIVGMSLFVMESRHAVDMLALRVVIWIVNATSVESPYTHAIHYLEFKVDFGQQAFPHFDSLPWTSLSLLSEIARNTRRVIADRGGEMAFGMGVLLNTGGRRMLFTVKHVVDKATEVDFGNISVRAPEFRPVTSGKDPIVGLKWDSVDGDPPDVELIAPHEVSRVKFLTFINFDDKDDEKFICFVPKFAVKGGKLMASVDLKRGDSGGPVFAVLDDGTVRFCGVVSAGNPRCGGGNIVSFAVSDGEYDVDSDPEVEVADIRRFNDIRRERADMRNARLVLQRSLHEWRLQNASAMGELALLPSKFTISDMGLPSEVLALRAQTELDNARDNSDEDPGGGNRRNRRRKNREKDEAVRKRALVIEKLKAVLPLLRQGYPEPQVLIHFDTIAGGVVPELNIQIPASDDVVAPP